MPTWGFGEQIFYFSITQQSPYLVPRRDFWFFKDFMGRSF